MKKILLSIIFIYCISASKAATTSLQIDLETSYKSYLDALNDHNITNIQANMSSHGFMNLKNQASSWMLKYPEGVVMIGSSKMVNTKKLKYLSCQENAATANCIYYGKGFNYAKALIIVKYVKEDNKWKFDDIVEKSNDDIITKVESKDLSFLAREYAPGVAPSVAKELPMADYSGLFNLQVEGYRIVVKVNGTLQDVANGTVVDGLILGGLKKGINYVEFKLTPIINAEKTNVKLSIRANSRTGTKEVFNYQDAKPSIMFTREFEIN